MLKKLVRGAAARFGMSIVPDARTTVLWGLDVPATAHILRKMRPVATGIELKRFGGDGDGAYLIPDDLEGVQALFSPGVSTVASFEEQMASRGIECYLADASVEAPPLQASRINFLKKFIGVYDGEDYIRLDTWVDQCAPGQSDLVLQMDIEDAEWDALASAPTSLMNRFRIIVVEYHNTVRLLDSSSRRSVMERLMLTHNVVHLHVNNAGPIVKKGGLEFPTYVEATYLRKDRAEPTGTAKAFPHPLDIVNVPSLPPLILPKCWRE